MVNALVALVAALALSSAAAAPASSSRTVPWWHHLAAPKSIPMTRDVPIESSTPMIIARYGYPSETHTVQTEDGYLLTLHRIPNPGKPAIYLQHGILSSSADWVVLGPAKALGFLLFDAGYDVWLGNFRGNTYSKAHVKLSPKEYKFWDFSWHEMGMHDIPAMIDTILEVTANKDLVYVAHSQGTTAFMVTASMRPEYNEKVKAFIAMAPVVYLGKVASLPLQIISKAVNELEFIAKVIGLGEFLPSSAFVSSITSKLCADGNILQSVCTNILFMIAGYDTQELDTEMLPEIMLNVPAGASTKQLLHYGQLMNSDKFRQYDLGIFQNLLHYKLIHPPDYPLKKITTRVYLHHADNDLLAVPKGVERLAAVLPNVKETRRVPHESYNHLDFLYGRDSRPLIYDDVMASIEQIYNE